MSRTVSPSSGKLSHKMRRGQRQFQPPTAATDCLAGPDNRGTAFMHELLSGRGHASCLRVYRGDTCLISFHAGIVPHSENKSPVTPKKRCIGETALLA